MLILMIVLVFLFDLIALYFIWVTNHGNSTIGQQHALFTFYHVKENETLLNAFIANIAFNNLVSMAALHYTTLIFYTWTQGCVVLRIAMFNKWSVMNLNIKGYNIFDCICILSVLLTLVSIAVRGSGRIRYNDVILDKDEIKKLQLAGKKVP